MGKFGFICNTKFCNLPNFVMCHISNIYDLSFEFKFIELGNHNFEDKFSNNLIH